MSGYFTSESVLRRVIGERAVALSAPRALLMMAAHPVAFAGFFAHTGSLDEPYERLRRTGEILDLIAWGDDRRQADRATARVRAIHRRIRGRLPDDVGRFPAGTPYRADDPELLLWILACMADSAMLVYERCVRTLTPAQREALWADYRVVGRLFGIPERTMPASYAAFRAYNEAMLASGALHVSEQARRLAHEIVLYPPVPLVARPAVELVAQVTAGLLPAELRRQYGLSWDPLRGLLLAGAAAHLKRSLPLLPSRLRHLPQARGELRPSQQQSTRPRSRAALRPLPGSGLA